MSWGEFEDLSLVQGTAAWLAARRERIGGSEISSIMRVSPYKTRRELWLEKTGRVDAPDIGNLPHVRRGVEAEPIARGMLEREYRVRLITPVVKHKKYPFLVASVDGLCNEFVVEIKTMSKDKHEEVRLGIVPEHYEMQCQWNAMIAEKNVCIFASYRPEDGTLYRVPIVKNEKQRRTMIAAALWFHRWVKRDIEPQDDRRILDGIDLLEG